MLHVVYGILILVCTDNIIIRKFDMIAYETTIHESSFEVDCTDIQAIERPSTMQNDPYCYSRDSQQQKATT